MEISEKLYAECLSLVKKIMKQRGMNHTELAKELGITPSTVHKMFTGQFITLERLCRLSLILDFNFFSALSDKLDIPEPQTKDQQRIYELEIENRTLMKILKADSADHNCQLAGKCGH